MKAWVLHGIDDFRYEEQAKPEPKAGEVLVAVQAAGICGSDIPRVFSTGAHVHPIVIGHEFAGRVCACGPDTDKAWTDRAVGVFPLIPCGVCEPCRKRQFQLCRNYNYLGSRCDGGFAEYVAVPEKNLIALPDGVTYEQAAMLEPMAVAVHAMRRGFSLIGRETAEFGGSHVQMNGTEYSDDDPRRTDAGLHRNGAEPDTIGARCRALVWGLGTIGMLLAMFLQEAGIEELYVIGNKDSQLAHARALGIPTENICDIRTADAQAWMMERTQGVGVDLFYECVGKNETAARALTVTAPSGAIVLVGNPYSDMTFSKADYWKILRNEIRVTGSWNSSFTGEDADDWHYVVRALAKGRVKPEMFISHRFDLPDLKRGFLIMRDKSEEYGKIMCHVTK